MDDLQPTILIVEDERIIAMELEMIARSHGYRVVGTVTSASDAIAGFTQFSPDIVLMDVTLSNADNGIDVASSLRELGDFDLVFCTAHTDETLMGAMKAVIPTAILHKPIRPNGLIATLESIAARRRVAAQEEPQ